MSIYRLCAKVICEKTPPRYGTPVEGAGVPEGTETHPHTPHHDDYYQNPAVKYGLH